MQTLSQQMLFEAHFKRADRLVESVCRDLDSEQTKIVRGIYRAYRPIFEAALSQEQISKVFADAESRVSGLSGNRTSAGDALDKTKSAATTVNNAINKVGKLLQDTRPVQFFDRQFEKLKTTITAKYPQLDEFLTQLGTWASANPGKTAAVIGIMTAVAALASGPGGGALAGQVLRGSVELLKGSQLSTAVGRGMKSAVVGWLAGQSIQQIGNVISTVTDYINPQPLDANKTVYGTGIGMHNARLYGTKQQLAQFEAMWQNANKLWDSENYQAASQAFQRASEYAKKITEETLKKMGDSNPQKTLDIINKTFDGISSAVQGVATGAVPKSGTTTSQSQTQTAPQPPPQTSTLTESTLNRVIAECIITQRRLIREGVMDKIAGMGKNITRKITADKLKAAWEKSNKPTDSQEIADMLQRMGISYEIVSAIYAANNIEIPQKIDPVKSAEVSQKNSISTTNLEQLQSQVSHLSLERAKQVLTMIQNIESQKSTNNNDQLSLFEDFNKLIENTIVEQTTGQSASKWIQKFIAAKTRDFDIDEEESQNFKNLGAQFEQFWLKYKKFPEDIAKKIIDAIIATSDQQSRDRYGDVSGRSRGDSSRSTRQSAASGGVLDRYIDRLEQYPTDDRVFDEAILQILKFAKNKNPQRYEHWLKNSPLYRELNKNQSSANSTQSTP